jgi:hypothetical protein
VRQFGIFRTRRSEPVRQLAAELPPEDVTKDLLEKARTIFPFTAHKELIQFTLERNDVKVTDQMLHEFGTIAFWVDEQYLIYWMSAYEGIGGTFTGSIEVVAMLTRHILAARGWQDKIQYNRVSAEEALAWLRPTKPVDPFEHCQNWQKFLTTPRHNHDYTALTTERDGVITHYPIQNAGSFRIKKDNSNGN